MGGADVPYLYDPPSTRRVAYPYSDFNPKAVTEAAHNRLSQQLTNSTYTTKKDGPLIDFNRHPDSYMVVPQQQNTHQPMSGSTKKTITILRSIQLALRIVTEIAALGLLAATICIKGTSGATTYLLRIAQAWDSLITIYAIVHMSRPAKARTPANSSSYHFFALFMDTALIPFYVYVALVTNSNINLPVAYNAAGKTVDGRWSSFFSSLASTNLLFKVTFFGACALGGLHLISIIFDIWLAVIFRKISHLPPDMNPLEDNLTGRQTTKHKHKNSEFTLNSNASEYDEKLSGSTFNVNNQSRTSIAKEPEARVLPFGHSRTGSSNNLAFSPHNPETARWSRHQYDGQQNVYQEAVRSPRSRYEIRPDGKLQVKTRGTSHSPVKRDSYMNVNGSGSPSRSRESVVLDTYPQNRSYEPESPSAATFTTARTGSPAALPNAAPTQDVVKAGQRDKLLTDNWYVLEDNASDMGLPSRRNTPAPPTKNNGYHALTHDYNEAPRHEVRPLAMNPPTPPVHDDDRDDAYPDPADMNPEDPDSEFVGRSVTRASYVSSVYSESAPSLKSSKNGHVNNGTPKGKYYGDLAAATRGVLGGKPEMPPSPAGSRTPSPEKKSRVISRTGADIADQSGLHAADDGRYAMRSRRDVSGKVAEEGRGGGYGRAY